MKKNQKLALPDFVLMALFIALTIIGTSIRIPVPLGLGNAFIHLGNSVLLLAVLLIGYPKGALAGGIGFFLFDILNGYALEAPYFLVEGFVVGGVATLAFHFLIKNNKPSVKIVGVTLCAGVTKFIMSYGKAFIMALLYGNNTSTALVVAIETMVPTVINIVGTIFIVSLSYYPLKKVVASFYKRTSLHR